MKTLRVLFVCLGNICRSPTAHGVFETCLKKKGLEHYVQVDSAGTAHWHSGKAPDARTAAAAARRGYDLSALRARQVSADDFNHFDYILAMDASNLVYLQQIMPHAYTGKLGLFLDFAQSSSLQEVPDPYYDGEEGFEHVLDLVEKACSGLVDHLQERLGRAD